MSDAAALVDQLNARARAIYDPSALLPAIFALTPAVEGEYLYHLVRIDTSNDPRDAGMHSEIVIGQHHDGARLAALAAHMTTLRASIDLVWKDVWRDIPERFEIYAQLMRPLEAWDPQARYGGNITYIVRQVTRIPVIDFDSVPMTAAVHSHDHVRYMPRPNCVTAMLDGRVPPADLARTAFLIALDDTGRPLLAVNARRGLEVPGGHIENGEDAETAARREGVEEIGAHVGTMIPLGSQLLISQGHAPADWKYPFPIAHQAFFAGRIERIDPYEPNDECLDPRFPDGDREIPPNILPFVLAARKALGIVPVA